MLLENVDLFEHELSLWYARSGERINQITKSRVYVMYVMCECNLYAPVFGINDEKLLRTFFDMACV